ncbi:MAG: SLC13 family permease, partial [Vicinamibacteria bacterium]
MSLPLLSIVTFAVAILLSCFTPVNVGLISVAFAFVVGVGFGDMAPRDVAAGFPSALFLILVGVTLFFSQANANGTLDRIAKTSVRLARGNPGWIPVVLFALASVLASIGAGNIAATAMLAPIAMRVAAQAGISAFLMTVMVATGANCGALSPFAPTGIIANGLMERIGITGVAFSTFSTNFVAEAFVGLGGYFLLGGGKLIARGGVAASADDAPLPPLVWQQKLTLVLIAAWILGVLVFGVDVGMGAFVAAAILTLSRAADEEKAIRGLPWGTILMVSGVTVLIALLEKTGGMDLFTEILARVSSPSNVTGVIAFVTGLISVYSSSSGVV